MRDAVERFYIPHIDRIIYGPQQFIKPKYNTAHEFLLPSFPSLEREGEKNLNPFCVLAPVGRLLFQLQIHVDLMLQRKVR
jgi:hypothetical protein